MELSILAVMIALLQYSYFGFRTGFSRPKFNVPAPKMSGNDTWERICRVHLNTLEQLIVFIPALLTFSHYVSDTWGAGLGTVFIVARQVYSITYIKDSTRRLFPPSFLVNVILVVGTIVGIVMQLKAKF